MLLAAYWVYKLRARSIISKKQLKSTFDRILSRDLDERSLNALLAKCNRLVSRIKLQFSHLEQEAQCPCLFHLLEAKLDKLPAMYFCADCRPESNPLQKYPVQCKPCFEASNHKGHRMVEQISGHSSYQSCCCGDQARMNRQGFCAKHKA